MPMKPLLDLIDDYVSDDEVDVLIVDRLTIDELRETDPELFDNLPIDLDMNPAVINGRFQFCFKDVPIFVG